MAKDSINKDNKDEKGITVKKEDDLPEWYTQVVVKSQLADYEIGRASCRERV